MKVCINLAKDKKNIGPVIFAKRLARELEKSGIKIVDRIQKHDVLLAIIKDSYIEHSKKKRARIIQRLDGVYHSLDQDYELMNKDIKETFESADSVIYQSDFSKRLVKKFLGEKNGLDFIIPNGVDQNEFKKSNRKGKVFLCSAKWRPDKRLDSIVNGFSCLDLPAELWILGKTYGQYNNERIKCFGEVDSKQTFVFYNSANFFIHLAYDDNCPNSVVEALVSQLPVVCTSNGGTKELVRNSGEIIQEKEYDLKPFYSADISEVSRDKVSKSLQNCLENEKNYEFPREDLYMNNCAKKYIKAFEETLDSC